MKAILSFFPLFIIIGCKHTETKRIARTFPNGQVAELRYYNDAGDTLTYRKEAFYNNGAKGYIGEVLNAKKNGVWIWWYANGIKKDQCKYANGFEIDTVYHWYESGTIKQIEIVHKGKNLVDSCGGCNATIIRYYENGNKKEMFTYIDEISQDSSKTWYENGQLESYSFYKDGKEEGISESFYSNGQKRNSGNLVDGLRDGKITEWDSLGKIISVTNYKMGKIRD
jgi:antitoxin component YwqK of YwqJK toxin-antitoxin module